MLLIYLIWKDTEKNCAFFSLDFSVNPEFRFNFTAKCSFS